VSFKKFSSVAWNLGSKRLTSDVTGVTYGLKVTDKGGNPAEIPVSVSLVIFEWGLGLGATRTNHS